MSDYSQYHALGQGMGTDPNDPNRNNAYAQSPFHPHGAAPQGGAQPNPPIHAPPPQGFGHAQGQGFHGGDASQPDDASLAAQMGGMNLGPVGTVRKKKKDRHAYHAVEPTGSSQAFNGMPPSGSVSSQFMPSAAGPTSPGFGGHFGHQQGTPGIMNPNQFPAPAGTPFTPANPEAPAGFGASNGSADAAATIAPTGASKISLDDMPSVPVSRDSAQQHFLTNVYPTFERHVPPPSTISFVAYDQGNASPKFARLTMNNIPATPDGLQATGLPLGLLLQPLAPIQAGEAAIPVLDFGDAGPPRCRRCRAYINPFMMFRSGGSKFACNLCTHPNDTPPEYFCATSPQGVRVDRDQRPELHRGTVEFVVPKEYWTREPVGLRWLFIIDATQESYNKGFMETFCDGILNALYGGEADDEGESKPRLPEGAKVGFLTYDKDIHFYNMNVSCIRASTRLVSG